MKLKLTSVEGDQKQDMFSLKEHKKYATVVFLTNLVEVSAPFMTSPQTVSQTLSGIAFFSEGKRQK